MSPLAGGRALLPLPAGHQAAGHFRHGLRKPGPQARDLLQPLPCYMNTRLYPFHQKKHRRVTPSHVRQGSPDAMR